MSSAKFKEEKIAFINHILMEIPSFVQMNYTLKLLF